MDSNSSPSSTSLNAGMDAKRIVGIAYVVFPQHWWADS